MTVTGDHFLVCGVVNSYGSPCLTNSRVWLESSKNHLCGDLVFDTTVDRLGPTWRKYDLVAQSVICPDSKS